MPKFPIIYTQCTIKHSDNKVSGNESSGLAFSGRCLAGGGGDTAYREPCPVARSERNSRSSYNMLNVPFAPLVVSHPSRGTIRSWPPPANLRSITSGAAAGANCLAALPCGASRVAWCRSSLFNPELPNTGVILVPAMWFCPSPDLPTSPELVVWYMCLVAVQDFVGIQGQKKVRKKTMPRTGKMPSFISLQIPSATKKQGKN